MTRKELKAIIAGIVEAHKLDPVDRPEVLIQALTDAIAKKLGEEAKARRAEASKAVEALAADILEKSQKSD
ncbi:MAG: hypothetical protein WDN47_01745 [Candidatus Doudnabacteria bacterium]